MEIVKLVKGDIFEVVRNNVQYKFDRLSIDVKPRDFFATNLKTGVSTSINLQTKIKMIKPINEQVWYFTFGSGQPHQNCYHKINGAEDSAIDAMIERFSDQWAEVYSEKDFEGQIEAYNLKEIK